MPTKLISFKLYILKLGATGDSFIFFILIEQQYLGCLRNGATPTIVVDDE